MGAVHECGQRYIHVHEGLSPCHAGGGWVGGFAYTTSDVVGEMCTKKGITVIYSAQRVVGYLLL